MQEKTQNRVYEIVRCVLHTTPKNIYPLGGSTTRTPKWYRKKID